MSNNHNVPRCHQISEARPIWRFGGTASSMRVATSSTTTPLWRWTAKAQLFSSRPTSQFISPDRKVSLLLPNGNGLLMILTVFVLLNVSMLLMLAMFRLLAYCIHTVYFLMFKNNETLKIPNNRLLSPVHTKYDNYKDNYKDNDISVHTSELYHLFILSTPASSALNSPAPYSRMDSDWISMFVWILWFISFISWKK